VTDDTVSQGDLRKMYVDMYLGADKENPSVTVRLALLEDFMDKMASNISKLFWLGCGTLAAVVGDLLFRALTK